MSPVNARDVVQISYMQGLQQADTDQMELILHARNYYKGKQIVFLTKRMREYLNLSSPQFGQVDDFRMNIVQTIVMAVLDELSVNNFDTSEKVQDDETPKPQAQWAQQVWDFNRFALTQYQVMEGALRDSEAFVLVDFDDVAKMPRLIWHERFIDTPGSPLEPGFYMVYSGGDTTQKPLAAVHEWLSTETIQGKPRSFRRRNVHYADRIEKFYQDSEWEHYDDGTGVWPTPWVDGDGKPLGLNVISFSNFGGTPEATEALPMQNALNKIMLDVLAEADGAFKMFFVAGDVPTTDGLSPNPDGSNAIQMAPMTIISSKNSDAKMTPFDGGDPTKLMDTVKDIIMLVAQITGTPVSYFVVTKQIAGADTLKGQDKPLTKKVEKRKSIFGQNWEDVLIMARRLANYFGNAGLDESIQFYTQWKQVFDLETIKMMREVLGVPQETLWGLYGFSQEQIAAMKKTDDYRIKSIALEMQEIMLMRMKTGADLVQNDPNNTGA